MLSLCGSMFTVKLLVVLGIVSILGVSTARADPPSRLFVGNFIGNDATVENYLSISGGVDSAQDFESLYLEKTISPNSSFSLFVGYQRLEQEGEDASASGFSNLGLGYKHLLISIPRQRIRSHDQSKPRAACRQPAASAPKPIRAPAAICFFRRASLTCPTR